ncbi:hypothetical protein HZA57_08795, partial [Candidatus Poribacteria bacterium]|nr:hypothetical protein [Candidatus Poribacteria bacterium]
MKKLTRYVLVAALLAAGCSRKAQTLEMPETQPVPVAPVIATESTEP